MLYLKLLYKTIARAQAFCKTMGHMTYPSLTDFILTQVCEY